jgi:hypothetical protein
MAWLLVVLLVLAGCANTADQQATEEAAAQLTATASAPEPTATPTATNTPLPTDTPTSTTIPTPTNTPLPSIDDLIIDEKGFAQDGETLVYAFVTHNPDEHQTMTDALYQVMLYDTNDAVVATTTFTIPLHLPGQYIGASDNVAMELGTEIARIDIQPIAGSYMTIDSQQPVPLFQVDQVGFFDKTLATAIGIVKNAYPEDIPNVLVSALAYNEQGVLVGGGSIVVEHMPANGQQYVEIPLIFSEMPNGGVVLYPSLTDASFALGEPSPSATDPMTGTNDLQSAPVLTSTTTMTDTDDIQDTSNDGLQDTETITDTEEDSASADDITPTPVATSDASTTPITATTPPDDTPESEESEALGEDEEDEETVAEGDTDSDESLTATPTPTASATAETESTTTPSPVATSTLTPTLTPTPTVPRPTGACLDNAPDTAPNGPLAWLPRTNLAVDNQGVVCVWVVEENKPIAGAEVKMNLLYLDKNVPQVVEADTATTGELGIAELSFTVPDTYELEFELIVTYDGENYDWRNYPDELGLTLYTD